MFDKATKYIWLTAVLFIFTACIDNTLHIGPAPAEGSVEYNIHYSNSIKTRPLSSFLPHKLTAEYNTKGIKITLPGALGMYKIDMVNYLENSFLLVKLQSHKLSCPFTELIDSTVVGSIMNEAKINYNDTSINIGGWESKHMILKYDNDSIPTNVDLYYVPTAEEQRDIKNFPLKRMPGLITGINIQHGEDIITIIAYKTTDKTISDNEFTIPDNYQPTTSAELQGIVESLMK